MAGGTLDKSKNEKCKVEELTGNDAQQIEEEINNKLKQGWTYRSVLLKSNKIYLIFIR